MYYYILKKAIQCQGDAYMTRKNAWDNSRESINLSFAVVVEQMSWWLACLQPSMQV